MFLFLIQICAAAKNASKCSVPTDEGLRHALTGPGCDYLPRRRRSSSNLFILGSKTLFDSTYRLILAPMPVVSNAPDPEGGPGRVLR